MTENRVVALRQKGAIDDPLTEILRTGARRLIAQAVEAEFETFLVSTAELVLPDGCRRVVRHGHDPVKRRGLNDVATVVVVAVAEAHHLAIGQKPLKVDGLNGSAPTSRARASLPR